MSVEYVNTNMYYIGNRQNDVYGGKYVTRGKGNNKMYAINTGWHFIPNNLYSNYLTPRQWHDLVTNHSAHKLDRVEIIVQNMIPLTDNLSIEQNTTFMTFNNTIYALAFQDNSYETTFVEEQTNLLWREGVIMKQDSDTANPTVEGKLFLPLYIHYLPAIGSAQNKCFGLHAWDPMVHANTFQELRPGKNAVTFSWQASEEKWYASSIFTSFQNYSDISGKPDFNISTGNYQNTPLTPTGKFRQSAGGSQIQSFQNNMGVMMPDYYWAKPIPNFFIKMLPIFDTKNSLLQHEGQLVITRKIYFSVRPRIGGINFPTLPFGYLDQSKLEYTLKDKPQSTWYMYKSVGQPNRTEHLIHGDPANTPIPYVQVSTQATTSTTNTVTNA